MIPRDQDLRPSWPLPRASTSTLPVAPLMSRHIPLQPVACWNPPASGLSASVQLAGSHRLNRQLIDASSGWRAPPGRPRPDSDFREDSCWLDDEQQLRSLLAGLRRGDDQAASRVPATAVRRAQFDRLPRPHQRTVALASGVGEPTPGITLASSSAGRTSSPFGEVPSEPGARSRRQCGASWTPLTARSAAPRARAPSRARSRRPSPSPATRAADAGPRTP